MAPPVEIIDIDSSDDDEPQPGQSCDETKPPVNEPTDQKLGSLSQDGPQLSQLSPQELLEHRRRRIDQLLETYLRYHDRLKSVEYLMNPVQKQKWHNHLATSAANQQEFHQVPTSSEPTFDGSDAFARRRPPWFIDPPSELAPPRRSRATTGPRKRRYKKKRRAPATTSRISKSRNKSATTSFAATSYPKASSSSDRKPTKARLQAVLARVKKERS